MRRMRTHPHRDVVVGRHCNITSEGDRHDELPELHVSFLRDVWHFVEHEMAAVDLQHVAFVGCALEIRTRGNPRIDQWL